MKKLFLAAGLSLNSLIGALVFESELLYLTPQLNGDYYGIQVINGSSFYHSNNPGFKPAFRLGLSAPLWESCTTLQLRYTNFCGGNTDRAQNTAVPIFSPVTGFAISRTNYRLYSSDLTLHYPLLTTPRFDFDVFSGVNFTWFRYKELVNAAGFGARSDITIKSFFGGIGPQIGCNFKYGFWKGLSMIADARASFLVTQTQYFTTLGFGGPVVSRPTFQEQWSLNPVFDTKLGLNYEYSFNCASADVEFGYNFMAFPNAVYRATVLNTFPPFVFHDLSFHGPYAKFAIAY